MCLALPVDNMYMYVKYLQIFVYISVIYVYLVNNGGSWTTVKLRTLISVENFKEICNPVK